MAARIGRQGGWVGLIMMLLALAIVAWLARDALRAYGLLPSPATVTTKAGSPGERARAPAAVDATDPTSATVAPQSAIERARGVEDTIRQQAEQQAKQVEGMSR
jgi:hypothetical protein